MPTKPVTELDRLSYVVNCIDQACTLYPLGAYKKNTLGEVKRNEAFCGLGSAAMSLSSYALLRKPKQEDKKSQCDRKADMFVHDFLDKVNEEYPKQAWSVLSDSTKTAAMLRNRMWPGFFAWSRCNSSTWGALYVGDGLPNPDLPFQI